MVLEEKPNGKQTITCSNQMILFQIKVQNLARIGMESGVPVGRCK